jgi:hypothetical protein
MQKLYEAFQKGRAAMKKRLVLLIALTSLVLVGSVCAQAYPPGIVHYWKFDDGSGTTAIDSVGSNNGTLYGPTWVTGQVLGALNFDGIDDIVEGQATVSPYGDFSMCAWFKMDELPTGYQFLFQTALGHFYLYAEENGQVPIGLKVHEYRDGNQTNHTSYWDYFLKTAPTNIQPGEWHFVVMTADDNDPNIMTDDVCEVYLDGQHLGTIPWALSGLGPDEYYEYTVIGANRYYYHGTMFRWGWFDGEIDEVAVFDRVLTPEEIQQFYLNGLNGQSYELLPPVVQSCPQEMVSYWKFDEDSGTTAYDSVGSNNGTLTPLPYGDGPTWDTGQVNGALNFDGSDDYVSIPDSDAWAFGTNNYAIEAWVRADNLTVYNRHLIAQNPYNSGIDAIYYKVHTDGGVHYEVWEGNVKIFSVDSAPGEITAGIWYHLVLVRNGDEWTVYKNGNSIASTTYTAWSYPNWDSLTIGAVNMVRPYGTWGYFDGTIDEVAIYNSELTPEEIQQHYINGLYGEQYCTPSANEPPVADPKGPYLCAANVGCEFDGSLSDDPDGDELTYAWIFGDSNSGIGVSPTHTYSAAGIYDVCLTVNDGHDDSVQVCTLAVIYDPDAGFVTGGGWIDSPAGAYKPDESLTGKATFGFVSKYKKDATEPTGQTEFQFHAADLNFHSESYQWLVVTGSNYARFKGSGTINGEGDYKFMLWAGDDEPDTFRIKIWVEDEFGTETVTYDNGMDQAISGGSIKVHTK